MFHSKGKITPYITFNKDGYFNYVELVIMHGEIIYIVCTFINHC